MNMSPRTGLFRAEKIRHNTLLAASLDRLPLSTFAHQIYLPHETYKIRASGDQQTSKVGRRAHQKSPQRRWWKGIRAPAVIGTGCIPLAVWRNF